MFDARQYINSSVAVRLSDLQNALEYSVIAEYNTHVVTTMSGVFLVTTEGGWEEESHFGGRLIAIRGAIQ